MSQRIPDSVIDEIKGRAEISAVIGRYVTLKKTGKNHSSLCPFHDEKTASFTVNSQKQMYYCFGCGAGGNVVDFLMEHERLSFPAAIRKLGSELGIDVPNSTLSVEEKTALSQNGKILQALSFAGEKFTGNNNLDTYQSYTQERGLNAEATERFELGFAPDSWDFITGKTHGQWLDHAKQAGIVSESARQPGHNYDFFRDRLMFPVKDLNGRIIGFSGRAIGKDNKPKYLNTPETPVFKKSRVLYGLYEAMSQNDFLIELVIVEGHMDVVSMSMAGITNAAATMGTTLTRDHCEVIFSKVESVVFVFDGDKAGFNAAVNAAETVLPYLHDGRSAKFVFLDEGDDPDSIIKSGRLNELKEKLASPVCVTRFLLRYSIDLFGNQKEVSNRAKTCKILGAMVGLMPQSFLREMFISDISQRMKLDSNTIRRLCF